MHFEKGSFLAKLVELGIAVKKAGGDKLVKYAHDKRWKDGEEDIVEGKGPRFVNDLSGEAVLERVLDHVREL